MALHPPQRPRQRPALTTFLRWARSRRYPADALAARAGVHEPGRHIPTERELLGGRRHSRTLTQRQTAQLLGVSSRQYEAWERGQVRVPPQIVPILAVILGLDAADTGRLHRLSQGRDPAAALTEPGPEVVPHIRRRQADLYPHPVYYVTLSWRILYANPAFYMLWPFMPRDLADPASHTWWLVSHPQARAWMVRWERDWAGGLFGQIWAAYLDYPQSAALAAIVSQVAAEPGLRRVWAGREEWRPHADQDIRELAHPRWGRTRVAISLDEPVGLRAEGIRRVHMDPESVWAEQKSASLFVNLISGSDVSGFYGSTMHARWCTPFSGADFGRHRAMCHRLRQSGKSPCEPRSLLNRRLEESPERDAEAGRDPDQPVEGGGVSGALDPRDRFRIHPYALGQGLLREAAAEA